MYSEALDRYLGIAILRVPEGLDYTNVIEDDDVPNITAEEEANSQG